MIKTQLEPGKIQRANPESNIKKMIQRMFNVN